MFTNFLTRVSHCGRRRRGPLGFSRACGDCIARREEETMWKRTIAARNVCAASYTVTQALDLLPTVVWHLCPCQHCLGDHFMALNDTNEPFVETAVGIPSKPLTTTAIAVVYFTRFQSTVFCLDLLNFSRCHVLCVGGCTFHICISFSVSRLMGLQCSLRCHFVSLCPSI